MPIRLPTVIKSLDLEDKFTVHPLCFTCHRIFDPTVPSNTLCCGKKIFAAPKQSVVDNLLGRTPPEPIPLLVTPIQVLSSALPDFLNRGINEKSTQFWKRDKARSGHKTEIWHADVWKNIRGADGHVFFDSASSSDELHLGVTLSIDWFTRKTSVYGPSSSSGVISFCVSNLTQDLRYRAKNLIITAMTPGPKEPTADQLQNYLKIIVDDLLMLYNDGTIICTPQFPNGRRVRVVLLGVICDHPAMCKMTGFADKNHTHSPCPKCTVTQADLFSDKSMRNEFISRDGEEHRQRCFEYRNLGTDAERQKFFDTHGIRWTELARLPYFDLVRYTIIDPMHNLLLGVAKSQWYNQWILHNALRKSTDARPRELDIVHKFLATFEAPLWAGALPRKVGEPAGGSLSADEYKFATIAPWAIIIPVVWEEFLDEAIKDFATTQKKYKEKMAGYEKKLLKWEKEQNEGTSMTKSGKRKRTEDNPKPVPPPPPRQRMQKEEPTNFLRFATSLKLMVGRTVTEAMLQRAGSLLEDYLIEFKRLYGEGDLKPNHHWAVHTIDQLRDYGPMPNFWAFLTERLNKLLKSSNVNGRGGGQMEVSMMREFCRDAQLQAIIKAVSNSPEQPEVGVLMARMLDENKEALGTLQDAANDERSQIHVQPGPVSAYQGDLSDGARSALYNYYNSEHKRVRYDLERHHDRGTICHIMNDTAQFYEYALLDGRRITPSTRSQRDNAGSYIVKYVWRNETHAGEVVSIFHHKQSGIHEESLFAEIKWMKNLPISPLAHGDPWEDFPELEVESWVLNEYWQLNDPLAPPNVVLFQDIVCQLDRGIILTTNPPMWVTTSQDRASFFPF